MTKRVKHVTIMSRPGATDSTVTTRMICTMRPVTVSRRRGSRPVEIEPLGGRDRRHRHEHQTAREAASLLIRRRPRE